MEEYWISKRTQYSTLIIKEATDEPKYLRRSFLIKYFTLFYFGNEYSISETHSVSWERDKLFLMETSVA